MGKQSKNRSTNSHSGKKSSRIQKAKRSQDKGPAIASMKAAAFPPNTNRPPGMGNVAPPDNKAIAQPKQPTTSRNDEPKPNNSRHRLLSPNRGAQVLWGMLAASALSILFIIQKYSDSVGGQVGVIFSLLAWIMVALALTSLGKTVGLVLSEHNLASNEVATISESRTFDSNLSLKKSVANVEPIERDCSGNPRKVCAEIPQS